MTTTPTETGHYDRRGIPICVGDLIRVKHYRHRLRHEQIWMYFRVAEINGRYVVQNWNDLDPTHHQTTLDGLADSDEIEVVQESGLHYDERGEIITFNERKRKS